MADKPVWLTRAKYEQPCLSMLTDIEQFLSKQNSEHKL